MSSLDNVPVEFDEFAMGKHIAQGMQRPFQNIQRGLIKEKSIRFDATDGIDGKEILMFYNETLDIQAYLLVHF